MSGRAKVLPLLALALGLLAAACSEIRFIAGTRPALAALEERLILGHSSAEEVRAALGTPSGRGRTMLPLDGGPREVWSYYYETGRVSAAGSGTLHADMRRMFLFVYFDQDRYDGYLWFSSLPQ